MSSSTTSPEKKQRPRIWAILLWLSVWQAASMIVGRDYLLASPLSAAGRFFALLQSTDFLSSIAFSTVRILGGFFSGLIAGIVTAILSRRYKYFDELCAPLITVLRAIPVASYVIIALIWMPSRSLSALIVFLVVYPVITTAANAEIERADPQMLETAAIFRFSPLRRIVYVYALPSLGSFEKTCVTAVGLAWKSGAAAELIAIPSGSIGEKLYNAKVYLMTGDLAAWTFTIILLSVLSSKAVALLLRLAARTIESR